MILYHPHQGSAQLVLDYSGEHNIPITTNPNGFFVLFPCYLLLRAYALPKIRSPLKGEAVICVKLAYPIASPSRGEAGRSTDEGGIISFLTNKFGVDFSLPQTDNIMPGRLKPTLHLVLI